MNIRNGYWNDLVIWLAMYSLFFLFLSKRMELNYALYRSTYMIVWSAVLHYLNLILIRKYLKSRNYWSLGARAALLIMVISVLRAAFESNLLPDEAKPLIFRADKPELFFYIMSTLSGYVLSSMLLYTKYMRDKEKEMIEVQRKQSEMHLRLLQEQIKPHSLFNSLNNIYSLIIDKRDEAGEALQKLSEMLRYALYASDSDLEISVKKEAAQIESLIWLFQLKSDRSYDIQLNIQISGGRILPMLLVPFVENALKYCDFESNSKAFVLIDLFSDAGRTTFSVINTFRDDMYQNEYGGLGLMNVRSRLSLFYGDRYSLEVSKTTGLFNSKLEINGTDTVRGN